MGTVRTDESRHCEGQCQEESYPDRMLCECQGCCEVVTADTFFLIDSHESETKYITMPMPYHWK